MVEGEGDSRFVSDSDGGDVVPVKGGHNGIYGP